MAKNLTKLKKILIFRLQRHKDFNRTITGSLNKGKAIRTCIISLSSQGISQEVQSQGRAATRDWNPKQNGH